jgi:predicted transcriptional regulator
MRKDAAITVRIPADLKRRLEGSARKARRSLSAEIAHRLESSVTTETESANRPVRPMTGRFAGMKAPTEADFAEVRRMLWRRLTPKGARNYS